MTIVIKETKDVKENDIVEIYKANKWSSGDKPEKLVAALFNSHSFVTAWHNDKLVGLGNAISDGSLVVYYPHLIVSPKYQSKGVGKLIMKRFQEKYNGFHQQVLVADGTAINFYEKQGFEKAGETQSMWIYKGADH